MRHREEAVVFECAGESLVGVVALPEAPSGTGVLIVVGGPQYRAGSHRQFVLLARFLAAKGVACMRFDYRGMGDSTGEARDFRDINEDIEAAIDVFLRRVPTLEGAVLWALCDGASASCLYAAADPRVHGLVLVNPWVRTEAGEAQVYLRHYYSKRLIDGRFWKKLLRGEVKVGESLRSLASLAGKAGAGGAKPLEGDASQADLPDRMSAGLARCDIPLAIFLSGNDYVAREFEQEARKRQRWAAIIADPQTELLTFESADHTFSSAREREEVAVATWRWLIRRRLAREASDKLMEPLG